MKKLIIMFVLLTTGASLKTGNDELDKGLKEANDSLGRSIKGTLWRSSVENEASWITDLILGEQKFTKVTVNTVNRELKNMFIYKGAYTIIDSEGEFISLLGGSSQIKDFKGYTKIYIMDPGSIKMKSAEDEYWHSKYAVMDIYLVKIKDDKMYMHSLAQEDGQYYFNYTKEFSDESAEIFRKV